MLGLPIPGHRDFDEINLRFYVRRRAEDGHFRRAVVFVRELVPRRAIALVARWCYNEPYTAVPMRHEIEMAGAAEGQPGRAAYAWRLGSRWHRLEVRTRGRPVVPEPATEAAFITEHYWGYTVQRDGGTTEYQVEHPPWRIWEAAGARFDCDVEAVYGPGFAECLAGRPRSAFLAEGSEPDRCHGRARRQAFAARRRSVASDTIGSARSRPPALQKRRSVRRTLYPPRFPSYFSSSPSAATAASISSAVL